MPSVSVAAIFYFFLLASMTRMRRRSRVVPVTGRLIEFVHTIHACIQTYIHTPYIHTSIHPYIHTSIHPYIHTSIHPYIHTSIHQYIHTSIHPYIHTSIHQYIHTSMLEGSRVLDGFVNCLPCFWASADQYIRHYPNRMSLSAKLTGPKVWRLFFAIGFMLGYAKLWLVSTRDV